MMTPREKEINALEREMLFLLLDAELHLENHEWKQLTELTTRVTELSKQAAKAEEG